MESTSESSRVCVEVGDGGNDDDDDVGDAKMMGDDEAAKVIW